MTNSFQRWLEYEGYDNFRDLGGYATTDGRTTRWQRLYRTGSFVGSPPPSAIAASGLLNIQTVVDLRTVEEVEHEDPESSNTLGPKRIHLPLNNPELEAIRLAGASGMGDLYLTDFDPKIKAFAEVLTVIAESDNLPVVVRCRGGKDRTGILIALLLDLLGVPDETIIEEYALTDTRFERIPRNVYEATVARFKEMGLDPEILRTRPATMARFLSGFREKWGTAENLANEAGVSPDVVSAVRSNLLE